MKLFARLFSSRDKVGGAKIPTQVSLDPDLHYVRIEAAPRNREGDRHAPRLKWTSSDTSVIRLQVDDESTLSALAIPVGPGRAIVTITDGEVMECHAIQVERPQPVRQTSLGITMKKVGKE